MINFMFDF